MRGGGYMSNWYTVAELAKESAIAEQTIRRYISKFSVYFISTGGSRGKKYEESALAVIKRIKELYSEGYETAGVDSVIKNEFPMIVADNNRGDKRENSTENTDTTAFATAEDVVEIKAALTEQREFNRLLIQKLDEQNRYIKDIKEALQNRDQLLLEKFTEQKNQEIEVKEEVAKEAVAPTEKTGFFKRLFKR